MAKLVGRLIGRLVCPSMTDETLGLLLCLPLFRLNPLLVRSLAGDGGVVLVEEAMAVKEVWAGPQLAPTRRSARGFATFRAAALLALGPATIVPDTSFPH